MSKILSLFSQSPFEPLYEHRLKVRECVGLVKPLFEAVLSGNRKEQKTISAQIARAEKEADKIKIQMRRILPKGIFLPVNREDLLRYLKIQDDLADAIEDISVLLSMKDLSAPETLSEQLLTFIDCVLNVCYLADETTDHLKPLVDSGFKGDDVQKILDLVEKGKEAERRADDASLALAQLLFTFEDQMKPTDIFLWFRIFDVIGDLADYAENTGEWLRNMLTR